MASHCSIARPNIPDRENPVALDTSVNFLIWADLIEDWKACTNFNRGILRNHQSFPL